MATRLRGGAPLLRMILCRRPILAWYGFAALSSVHHPGWRRLLVRGGHALIRALTHRFCDFRLACGASRLRHPLELARRQFTQSWQCSSSLSRSANQQPAWFATFSQSRCNRRRRIVRAETPVPSTGAGAGTRYGSGQGRQPRPLGGDEAEHVGRGDRLDRLGDHGEDLQVEPRGQHRARGASARPRAPRIQQQISQRLRPWPRRGTRVGGMMPLWPAACLGRSPVRGQCVPLGGGRSYCTGWAGRGAGSGVLHMAGPAG